MTARRALSWLLLSVASSILAAACSLRKVPIVGGPSALQTESVRSIKTIQVRRIAVMPLVEAGDQSKSVAEGAAEAVTAELYSQMELVGGWELVPEFDVTRAMLKLPPTTTRNLDANALALGREVSVDAVLYGTVERYKERVGLDYAAASPASVAFTLHLVDLRTKQVVWTVRFSKSQKALTENIMNLVNFVQNQGRWVRAHEIAMEGVQEAVADLREQLALNENIKRFETGTYEELKRGEHRYESAP